MLKDFLQLRNMTKGGTGGAADWNTLKNKPFGEIEGYIVPETVITLTEDGEGIFEGVEFSLTVGEKYTVNWNGTDYECTAQEFADPESGTVMGAFLGDIGAMMGGESTGEPFIIGVLSPEFAAGMGVSNMVLSADGSNGDIPVSIKGKTFVKIPNEYLDTAWTPQMVKGEELLANTLVVYEGTTWGTTNINQNDIKDLEKVIVYFDNVRYETDVNYHEALGYYIGNGSLINNEYLTLPVSPEPFLFAFLSTRMNAVSIKENGHTVAIYKESENITPLKLPKEYQSGDDEVKCEWTGEGGVISWSNYDMNRITLSEYRKILAQGKKLAINIKYGMYSYPIARDDVDCSIIFMSGFNEATGTPTFTKYTFTD